MENDPQTAAGRAAPEPRRHARAAERRERVTVRPIRPRIPLRKERGVWIYRTERPLEGAAIESLITQLREERS